MMAQHQHLVHRHHLLQHHHRNLTMKIPRTDASLMKSPFKSKVLMVPFAHQSAACSRNVHQTSPQELQQHRNALCRMPRHIASIALSSAAQIPTTSVDQMRHARAFNLLAFALMMMTGRPPIVWRLYSVPIQPRRLWCRLMPEPSRIAFCATLDGIFGYMPCQDEFATMSNSLCGCASTGVV